MTFVVMIIKVLLVQYFVCNWVWPCGCGHMDAYNNIDHEMAVLYYLISHNII